MGLLQFVADTKGHIGNMPHFRFCTLKNTRKSRLIAKLLLSFKQLGLLNLMAISEHLGYRNIEVTVKYG